MTDIEKQKLALEQERRMARLEEKTDNIVNDVAEIKQTIKDFIKEADQKYAPKWVATLVYFLSGGTLLYLIQKVIDNIK